nr:PD-(D/E)XK motif protein [Ralstonia mannitolilytica]
MTARFHSTCRVVTPREAIEDQFAVVSCDSSIPELYELFVRSFAAVVGGLPQRAGTSDLRNCLQGLLNLFRVLTRPSRREVTGLWAELYVISVSERVEAALQAWHADHFERFDFSSEFGCLEVKATTKERRIHEFSLEQLREPTDGRGYVASLLLRPMTGGVGIMDLATSIEAQLPMEPGVRQKLWENVAATLGSDFSERLDYRFDPSYAARHLAVYAMRDVPAPQVPSDPRITSIRFCADLSLVHPFAAGISGALRTVCVDPVGEKRC